MSRFVRLGSVLSWAVVPIIVVMSLFDLRRGLDGRPATLSAFVIGFAAITVATLPWALARRHEVTRTGRWIGGAWAFLMVYSLVSALTTGLPRITAVGLDQGMVRVGREHLVWPVVTAILTGTAAWGLLMAAPAAGRHRRVRAAALTLVLATLVAGPRTMAATGTTRLGTGLGGAAVLHVALLVGLGVLLGGAAASRNRGWTVVGLGGAGLAALGVLATGSRAGWGCLVLFVVLAVLRVARGARRPVLIGLGVVGVAGVAAVAVWPPARRLLRVVDTARGVNLRGGFNALNEHWTNWLTGAGSGRVWPWYAFDSGAAAAPPRNLVVSRFGELATNPHSVFFGVLVELGLIGLTALVVLCAVLLIRLVATSWNGSQATLLPRLAVACTLPAFLVDYYLFKNFGVSFVWWVVVAGYFGLRSRDTRERTADAAPPSSG